jgi:hypothetical protein
LGVEVRRVGNHPPAIALLHPHVVKLVGLRSDSAGTYALDIVIPDSSDPAGTKTYTIPTAELTVRLTLQPVGQWAASLAGDESITGHRERFQAAVLTRAESIEQTLPHARIPTIALAEIKSRGQYTGRRRAADPKFAVKTGLLQTGRLARCITATFEEDPDTKATNQVSHHDKALNSWYKLLRLLGVRLADIRLDANLHGIDQPPAYLAFWLIRQNQHGWEGITRQVPVAVLIDPTGRNIQACAPKVGWLPLHQAQREISRHHMLTDQKRSPEEITRFFENVFKSVAGVHPSLLLLTCAQNQRWGLPFLNNLKMEPDTIQFGQKPAPITRFPNVRHVRIRTTERDEVPDTYAVNQTTAGHAPGYWIASERTYFSTGEKPHTASKAIKSSSKVVSRWKKDDLVKPSPKGRVWNARALELSVAAIQPNDEPEAWAALTHDLRWAAPHYKYATTLPWPLLVAKQLGQFIMPVELLEEIDDAETEAADVATGDD